MNLSDLDEMIAKQRDRLSQRDEANLPVGLVHEHIWHPDPQNALRAKCSCGAIGQVRKRGEVAP